ERATQLGEEPDDRGLRRHVERRHRLVEHDELRGHRERARDGHALLLASRQRRRPSRAVVGIEAHRLEQLAHAAPALPAATAPAPPKYLLTCSKASSGASEATVSGAIAAAVDRRGVASTVGQRTQRARRSGATVSSAGVAAVHAGATKSQRGAKTQPGGRS